MRPTSLWLALVTSVAALPSAGPAPARDREAPLEAPASEAPAPPPAAPHPRLQPSYSSERQRGVALGLFAEDVSFSYAPLLNEIAALGASHVALVVPLYQDHAASTRLALHTRLSPSLSAVADAIRLARRAGLAVTLFPIVRLQAPRGPGEWRGTLAPDSPAAWFASYEERLGELAALGAMAGAGRLVVGSELSTLDVAAYAPQWARLLDRVRGLFNGPLVYSANWDHYRDAKLLDLVDEAGVTAYFNLREPKGPSDEGALTARWRSLRTELESWRRGRPAQPFVFTEVGYRSRAGSSAAPWNEEAGGAVDLDEQRRAFAAFLTVWGDAPSLSGYYVWNWYGYGGPTSDGYTPRGKPAAEIIKQLLSL